MATSRGGHKVRLYAVPLALFGISISAYHIVIERFPDLESGASDPTNPCSLKWVKRFGFVTIPEMAATAFALPTYPFFVAINASGHLMFRESGEISMGEFQRLLTLADG